jgi:hypothetical protein
LADGFAGIIDQLERQKAAIEKALAALRDIEGEAPLAVSTAPATTTANSRRSEGQKARWAAKKALVATPAKATRKGGMTEAGREKLREAMKRRWAVKRTVVKKRGRPKKAA